MVDTEYLVDDYYITAVSIVRVSLTDHRCFVHFISVEIQ